MWLAPDAFAVVWPQLTARVAELTGNQETLYRNGVPRWGPQLGEDTLPPEAGLDRTHRLPQGCYIGQEVIAPEGVGHVNRELSGFIALGDAPLRPARSLPAG